MVRHVFVRGGCTLALLLLAATALGCGGGGDVPEPRGPLPLLPSGTHLGVVYADEGGDGKPALDAAWSESLAAGVDAYQLSVPWDVLEPEPDTLDLDGLIAWLDVIQAARLVPYLVIPTIDTNTLRVPADLVDPTDDRALADGRAFDDPVLIERFGRLLDRVVPILRARGGFYLSVGNEVDIYLGERGGTAAFAAFAAAARDRVRTLAPELATGITLTWGGLQRRRALFDALLEVSDVLSLTYYPFDDAMQVRDPSTVAADLAGIVQAAGGRPVLLQEVGFPAGDEPTSDVGSSAELQRRFVVAFFEALPSRPEIRFASYFALNDFSEATVDRLLDYYDLYVEPFREFLATLGLHRADGTARPAFEAFLAGVRATRVREMQ